MLCSPVLCWRSFLVIYFEGHLPHPLRPSETDLENVDAWDSASSPKVVRNISYVSVWLFPSFHKIHCCFVIAIWGDGRCFETQWTKNVHKKTQHDTIRSDLAGGPHFIASPTALMNLYLWCIFIFQFHYFLVTQFRLLFQNKSAFYDIMALRLPLWNVSIIKIKLTL